MREVKLRDKYEERNRERSRGEARQGSEKEAGEQGGRESGVCAASLRSIRGPLYVCPATLDAMRHADRAAALRTRRSAEDLKLCRVALGHQAGKAGSLWVSGTRMQTAIHPTLRLTASVTSARTAGR